MTSCKCGGTGTIYVEGPCDAAPQEAPCPCLERQHASQTKQLADLGGDQ